MPHPQGAPPHPPPSSRQHRQPSPRKEPPSIVSGHPAHTHGARMQLEGNWGCILYAENISHWTHELAIAPNLYAFSIQCMEYYISETLYIYIIRVFTLKPVPNWINWNRFTKLGFDDGHIWIPVSTSRQKLLKCARWCAIGACGAIIRWKQRAGVNYCNKVYVCHRNQSSSQWHAALTSYNWIRWEKT